MSEFNSPEAFDSDLDRSDQEMNIDVLEASWKETWQKLLERDDIKTRIHGPMTDPLEARYNDEGYAYFTEKSANHFGTMWSDTRFTEYLATLEEKLNSQVESSRRFLANNPNLDIDRFIVQLREQARIIEKVSRNNNPAVAHSVPRLIRACAQTIEDWYGTQGRKYHLGVRHLLRPAEDPDKSADNLLRPVIGANESIPEHLLRSSKEDL